MRIQSALAAIGLFLAHGAFSIDPARPDLAALRIVREAAEKGDPISQWQLGWYYFGHESGARGNAEGVPWFLLAAGQDFAPAQLALSKVYHEGWGAPRDLDQAERWARRAAEQGDGSGMQNLAVFLQGKAGNHRTNLVEAYKWHLLAARHNRTESKRDLLELDSALKPQEIEQARKMAESFSARPSLLEKKRPPERFPLVVLLAENKQRNPEWDHWRQGWQSCCAGNCRWLRPSMMCPIWITPTKNWARPR